MTLHPGQIITHKTEGDFEVVDRVVYYGIRRVKRDSGDLPAEARYPERYLEGPDFEPVPEQLEMGQ